MRLFLKHLFRDIFKKPLQPAILILTITLSVAACVFSLTMGELVAEEFSSVQKASFGSADISISPNSTSKTRFIFADDAERLLDGRGKAVGSFELPMFFGEQKKVAFGVAVDFLDVGEIFDIEFLEYGTVTASSVSETVFVSSGFAKENGILLGDTVELEIVGKKHSYKVSGIAEKDFLASYDVMVDLTGVMRILASDNLILSSMGDSFKPAATLYIDVNDGESIDECISLLRSHSAFSDKEIRDVSEFVDQQVNNDAMKIAFKFSVMLAAILSAVLSFSCFYILSLKRAEENAVFRAAGAEKRILSLSQYLEVFVYWLVGGSLGLLISVPLVVWFVGTSDFTYATAKIDAIAAVRGALCILAVSLLTVAIFDISTSEKFEKKSKRVGKAVPWISAALFAAFVAITLIVHGKIRMILYVLSLLAMIATAFLFVPRLVCAVARLIERILEKGRSDRHLSLLYAAKNLRSVKILQNTALLVVLVVSVLSNMAFVVISGRNCVVEIEKMLCGDYAVIGASESCYNKVAEADGVASAHRVFLGTAASENGIFISALSVYDAEALSDGLMIETLPSGNQAVISSSVAEMMFVDVGDTVSVEISGTLLELEIIDVTNAVAGSIVFDSDHFNMPKNVIVANGKEGYSRVEVLDGISKKISLEMATVVTVEELFEEKTDNIRIFLESGAMLLITVLVFCFIGTVNNLAESYRSRKEDFELFALAGMGAKQIRRMKLCEILITFAFGALLGVTVAVVLILPTGFALEAYGFNAIGGFFA